MAWQAECHLKAGRQVTAARRRKVRQPKKRPLVQAHASRAGSRHWSTPCTSSSRTRWVLSSSPATAKLERGIGWSTIGVQSVSFLFSYVGVRGGLMTGRRACIAAGETRNSSIDAQRRIR
ncbi:hypothetical protein PMIN07_012060 [Paraphaeosphaeria minitans]